MKRKRIFENVLVGIAIIVGSINVCISIYMKDWTHVWLNSVWLFSAILVGITIWKMEKTRELAEWFVDKAKYNECLKAKLINLIFSITKESTSTTMDLIDKAEREAEAEYDKK